MAVSSLVRWVWPCKRATGSRWDTGESTRCEPRPLYVHLKLSGTRPDLVIGHFRFANYRFNSGVLANLDWWASETGKRQMENWCAHRKCDLRSSRYAQLRRCQRPGLGLSFRGLSQRVKRISQHKRVTHFWWDGRVLPNPYWVKMVSAHSARVRFTISNNSFTISFQRKVRQYAT